MWQWRADKIIGCAVWLCAISVAPITVGAQSTDVCQQLAGQFAAAAPALDTQSLVTLSQCITAELAARTSSPTASPSSDRELGGPPTQSTEPAVTQASPPPAAIPPNVFPSAPVPSPEFTSPSISPPDEVVWVPIPQRSVSTPSRAWGEWSPPYPWGRWPEKDTGFR